MPGRINPDGIPEWETGSPLPPAEELFIYKGQVYYWQKCKCPCGRPTGFNENDEEVHSMTLRLRGNDSGFPEIELFQKLGATPDQLADAYDRGGYAEIFRMMQDFIRQQIADGKTSFEEVATLAHEVMKSFGMTFSLPNLGYGDGNIKGHFSNS